MLQHSVSKKVGADEFAEALAQKVDLSALRAALDQKASSAEVESVRKTLERVAAEAQGKIGFRDMELHVSATKAFLEELSKEVALKANIKDLLSLLDAKANVEDVNSTLALVQKEVEKCVVEDELRKALDAQAFVNEALCAQNCVGRWIWKSGELKANALVPWEVQALNTCPDNFLWEKGKTSVVSVAPGLYELAFGFYSKKQPTVQIHLNGEPLMSVAKSQ